MKKKKKVLISITCILLILLSSSIYLVYSKKNQKGSNLLAQVSAPTSPPIPQNVVTLIDSVDKRTAVPKDEIPNVATVINLTQLQDQPFFAKARNGDKVLMYLQAKKAVLYRPTTGEIVQLSLLEIVKGDASSSGKTTFYTDKGSPSPSVSDTLRGTSAQSEFSGPVLKIKF